MNVNPIVWLGVLELAVDEQFGGGRRPVELMDGGRSEARGSEFAEFGDHFERAKIEFCNRMRERMTLSELKEDENKLS